ncbi:MAG: C40 family peptidase [Ruminococcus sp.]|jgi:cell wall-associated NlpC family hydrolase|nr:C40 family peptidase [Ruminococcus sp.]
MFSKLSNEQKIYCVILGIAVVITLSFILIATFRKDEPQDDDNLSPNGAVQTGPVFDETSDGEKTDINYEEIEITMQFEKYPHPTASALKPIDFSSEDGINQLVRQTPTHDGVAVPAELSYARQLVVSAAASLNGTVPYFWGGKYAEIGKNPLWNTSQKVIEAGDKSTGTYEKYGLDCSGYVNWVIINATQDTANTDLIGLTAEIQYQSGSPRAVSEAVPGDFVYRGSSTLGNHIGIVVENLGGNVLRVAHCSYGMNGVYIQDFFVGKGGVFENVCVPPYDRMRFYDPTLTTLQTVTVPTQPIYIPPYYPTYNPTPIYTTAVVTPAVVTTTKVTSPAATTSKPPAVTTEPPPQTDPPSTAPAAE